MDVEADLAAGLEQGRGDLVQPGDSAGDEPVGEQAENEESDRRYERQHLAQSRACRERDRGEHHLAEEEHRHGDPEISFELLADRDGGEICAE